MFLLRSTCRTRSRPARYLRICLLAAAPLLQSQSLNPPDLHLTPVPGAVVDYYNQHSGSVLTGDTPAFTMWMPTGTFLYVPPGGRSSNPIRVPGALYGMYADGTDPASVNFGIVKVTKLDFATPKNTQIELINPMAGFGSNAAKNVPKGWNGQYTAGAGTEANWKANNGWSMDGHLFLPIARQDVDSPMYTGYDSSIIRSDDAGLHWCNPYTLSLTPDGHCPTKSSEFTASGLASYGYTLQRFAEGDAPLPPGDPSYSAATPSMLFQSNSGRTSFLMQPILNCQDESISNSVVTCPAGDGHEQYQYLFAMDGNRRGRRLVRILRSKLSAKFGAADFSVYVCPSYWTAGACDGNQDEFWSSDRSKGTIIQFDSGTFATLHVLSQGVSVPTDASGTRRYLLVGKTCRMGGPCDAAAVSAPKPWGPWTLSIRATPPNDDFFYYPILPTFQSTSDGQFSIAISSSPRLAFPREGSPYFNVYNFSINRYPRNAPRELEAGLAPRGRPAVGGKLQLSYCRAPNDSACIPTIGLVSAMEFVEPEGYDWINGGPGLQFFPRPYATDVMSPTVCMVTRGHDNNRQWQGTNTAGTRGWGMMLDSLSNGMRDKCVMYDGRGSDVVTEINTHSTPAPLTGDQDWTVVTVFKVSNTTANGIFSWGSLNCAPTNYPPCANAGGGGVQATTNMAMMDPGGQGRGNGSLGILFDVAGGSLLNCCVGVATAPDQVTAGDVHAVAYVKKAGAVTPASISAPDPVLKIWRESTSYTGSALTLYGGANGGPPRTSPQNYFYFGWADTAGNSGVAGRHADVTYYYNLIYSRALSDAEWIRLYTYLKSALPQSPAEIVVQ